MGYSKKKENHHFLTSFLSSSVKESFNLDKLGLQENHTHQDWIVQKDIQKLIEIINIGEVLLHPLDDSWNQIAQYIVKPSWLLNASSKREQQTLKEHLCKSPKYLSEVIEAYRDLKYFQIQNNYQHNLLLTLTTLSILQADLQDSEIAMFLSQVQEHVSQNSGTWRELIEKSEWFVNQLQIAASTGEYLMSIANIELPTDEIQSLQSTVKMWLAQENARVNLQQKWIHMLMPKYQHFIKNSLLPPSTLVLSKTIWKCEQEINRLKITVYLGQIYIHWSGMDAPIDLRMNNELLAILPPKEAWQFAGDQYWQMPVSPSPFIHFIWRDRDIYVDISK